MPKYGHKYGEKNENTNYLVGFTSHQSNINNLFVRILNFCYKTLSLKIDK
jgi:hypothetical protein